MKINSETLDQRERMLDDIDEFYSKAFSRNIGLMTIEQQRLLRNSNVAIAGLGGVGGAYCLGLARAGIGNFTIADFDIFDTVNINRQVGATSETIGKQKSEVMQQMINQINPYAIVRTFKDGINNDNLDDFLNGASVVLDGLDFFAIEERLLLFRRACEKGIFVITAPPIGFGAALLVFDPNGMTFEKYFNIVGDMDQKEKVLRFGVGLSPSLIHRKYFPPAKIDFSGEAAPSLGAGTTMCCALVTTEALKIILNKKVSVIPHSTQFDPYIQKYKKVKLSRGNKCLIQRLKIWYLKREL